MTKIRIDVKEEAFNDACTKLALTLPNIRPVEWVQQVIVEANLKGVKPIQLGWRRFDRRLLPALVCHENKWFLVEKTETDSVLLTDADSNTLEILGDDLQNALVLLLKTAPVSSMAQKFSFKNNLAGSLVWREMFRESMWIRKVIVATVIVNILAVGTSLFALQVYDRVVPTQAYSTLTTLVAGMAIIILLDWFLKMMRARILDSMACSVDKRTSQAVFDHLIHVQLDVQPRSLGTLAAQVNGLDSVRQFLASGLVLAIIDLPFALMFIGFIALIGGGIAWVYLMLLPIAVTLGYWTQKRLRVLMYEQLMRQNERQGLLVDTIRGAESIRATNSGWRFSKEWQSITSSIDVYNIQQKVISSFSTTTTASLSTMAYVSALVVGVFLIEAGELTMGALIASSILGGRVIAPISQGVQQIAQWQNASQALNMANGVLCLAKERRDDQDLLVPDSLPSSLSIEGLRFSYPESPIQQVNISKLSIHSGERVLLLGAVGSGKSTLLKILAGLYRPSEGRIKLGLADLWEIDPQVVTSHLSYLPQTVHLFKGTLRSNLSLSGTATDSRLLRITKDLGIDAIAATSPLGLELVISEGGIGLSGGQQQLVALARVVINQPRIWILDEPTASLDAESEARVWRVLNENLKPEDILIVATHKPQHALEVANRVIVMQDGEIIKDGKPSTVLPALNRKHSIAKPSDRFPDVV